ncbi:phage tail protein [Streptomyces sp. NPDC057199]|uniref:phage tail protein n=1 Tax=Streptomyces sp. NPDC057199 TaxID=3346047 RepID=UPI003626C150
MDGDRAVSVLADPDQWTRCRHESTALFDGGGVGLSWQAEQDPEQDSPQPYDPAGLAFDRWGRTYRSFPGTGRIGVSRQDDTGGPHRPAVLCAPRGLAVDPAQRLYIAESGAGAVHVVDLWGERLLRRVPVRDRTRPHRRPLDVTPHRGGAAVLLTRPEGIVLLHGRLGPLRGPVLCRPPGAEGLSATRIADRAGQLHVLWSRPDGGPAVIARVDGSRAVTVDHANDLGFHADGTLVVARASGLSLRRFRAEGEGWSEAEPLRAPGFDGGAMTIDPDDGIAFTTAYGTGRTAGSAARYAPRGSVVSYRLDAGAYRTRWGRLFLDACVPAGTEVRCAFLTSDEDAVTDPLPWSPPGHGPRSVPHPEATPPLPPGAEFAGRLSVSRPLFRRPTGREWPWAQIAPDDSFETYEAPVDAPPGRYLWIVLRLTGTGLATPRVRALRVERPGHRLTAQLPRSWSRDGDDAAFLQRFLSPAEGLLHELDGRAALRTVLLDPAATPQEALGWLAGLLGLALDRRWPVPARRALIAQAYDLFRIRGTTACLERLLRLYLPLPISVLENWRLRGLGGAVLGTDPDGPAAPAVGGRAHTSGALGRFTVGGVRPGEDGYTVTAHRFSVLVPAELGPEQLDVIRTVVETHKPAHTRADICLLGAGMRVGRSLHVGLTSVVGPGRAWAPAVVGAVRVGRDGIVGVPAAGARVGETSIAGAVRVG